MTHTRTRDQLREELVAEITKRGLRADIGYWGAPSGSTGLRIVEIAADVALEMMGYPPGCRGCGHDHQHRESCTYNVGPSEPCGCEQR